MAGETVTYTFTATNIGNVTLTDVVISETSFSGSGEISELTCDPDQPATLAPTESITCTASYVVTQADVDAGQVHNQASVSGVDPDGETVTDTDTADVPAVQVPAASLVKSAEVVDVNGNALTDAGDEIWYSFTVTNDGNVTLTEVSVDDPLLAANSITITCDPTTLAPGESVVCTADAAYVITQADVDAGAVLNTAIADATAPDGSSVVSNESSTVVPTDQVAAIDLVKTADAAELVAGETVTYTFTATNIGNVTLTDVSIVDDVAAFTGSGEISELTCDPDQPATLAPGEQLTCTATYVVTQADVDAGQVHNQADVSGLDPDGGMVTDADTADVPGELAPAYTLVKSAEVVDVNGNALTDAGDEIWYSFELVNTGNVTLTEVSVDDPLLADAGITITCDPTTLLPGESVVCTADAAYVITQADVDAGGVHNVATGSVQVPPGSPEPEDPTDENLVPTDQVAGIDLVKSADATELVAGETVTYTFTATNIGNVTLTDVVISETSFTGSGEISELSCDPDQPAVLLPGEQLTCTATYVVTQADVDAGQVHNQADVSGLDPDGGMVTDADTADVPGELVPAYTLVKSAEVVDVNGNALTDAGDEIWYSFELVNTGNVTLTEVSVDDPLLAANSITITCDPTTLLPGESVVCTADAAYVITQADVDAGGV
ncbi:DUF11 domain-containing protein, partial [Nitriliruptor alkaliphilus]|uniref:DUF11 domain-containing protein n=1 Tax=Nitriliruptor alkaliphilus TaxID=427918 RepID=UPI001FDF87A7